MSAAVVAVPQMAALEVRPTRSAAPLEAEEQ
jgi:hypothetical protein